MTGRNAQSPVSNIVKRRVPSGAERLSLWRAQQTLEGGLQRWGCEKLVRYPSMPAVRQRSASPCLACAVRVRIGSYWLVAGSWARIVPVAAKPSIFGIWTSMSTRSKGCWARAASGDAPALVVGWSAARAPSSPPARRSCLYAAGAACGQVAADRRSQCLESAVPRARPGHPLSFALQGWPQLR